MNQVTKIVNLTEQPSKSCHTCFFISFCFVSQTTTSTVVKRQHIVKRNHDLCQRHTAFHSLYVVKSGLLKAYEIEMNGRERIANFYFPGEIVGFEAIYNNTFPFAVNALKETVVCEVPFIALLKLIQENIVLQQQLIALTSHRITLNNYVSYVRAEQRLSGFLISLATRLRCQDQTIEFTLPMTCQTIADHLGLATETVIRLMKRFTQLGLISANKKNILLRDIAGLEQIIES